MIKLYRKIYVYVFILLSVIISLSQVYFLMNESEIEIELKPNPGCETLTFSVTKRIFEGIFKCCLAFFAGIMINDFKFIKIGHI
jgi:hypothetical protein